MKFRKKPVVIEAKQYLAYIPNIKECLEFLEGNGGVNPISGEFYIRTLEGIMLCSRGDWIVKGSRGEFYPVKPEIFTQTYEPVEE